MAQRLKALEALVLGAKPKPPKPPPAPTMKRREIVYKGERLKAPMTLRDGRSKLSRP